MACHGIIAEYCRRCDACESCTVRNVYSDVTSWRMMLIIQDTKWGVASVYHITHDTLQAITVLK
jgi:hypothetical protein